MWQGDRPWQYREGEGNDRTRGSKRDGGWGAMEGRKYSKGQLKLKVSLKIWMKIFYSYWGGFLKCIPTHNMYIYIIYVIYIIYNGVMIPQSDTTCCQTKAPGPRVDLFFFICWPMTFPKHKDYTYCQCSCLPPGLGSKTLWLKTPHPWLVIKHVEI